MRTLHSRWSKKYLKQWFEQAQADSKLYSFSSSQMTWEKIAAEQTMLGMLDELRREGERLLEQEIPELSPALFAIFEKTGNRLQYESVYFERRRRLTTFALLSLLEPEQAVYRQKLIQIIQAILLEPTWCLPAHMQGQHINRQIDLFAAETGFSLAEILKITGDRLPAALNEEIRMEVNRRLFQPYLSYGPYHWETADHNWAAVCAGSIGAAALLIELDVERRAVIIEKALRTIEYYLSGFGSDGACLEGAEYWNYGFGYFVYFSDLLLKATGGKANLFADSKVKTIAAFQQRYYLIGNRPANFSDSAPYVNIHIGLSDYLASCYEEVKYPPIRVRAAYTDDHCSRFAPALRNLLWFQPEVKRSDDWEASSWYFADAQLLVSRHHSAAGSFGFAAKGGTNDEPHNHIDIGHFIIVADKEPAFAADLGSGEYTSQYFSEQRYQYDCTSAQGHSLPVINGCCQQAGARSKAIVLNAETGKHEDRFKLELSSCYSSCELTSFTRQFIWRKTERPVLELYDTMHFTNMPEQLVEIFITKCVPQIAAGCIRLKGSSYTLRLEYDSNRLMPAIEQRLFKNHHGQDETFYRIIFTSLKLACNIELQFQFIIES